MNAGLMSSMVMAEAESGKRRGWGGAELERQSAKPEVGCLEATTVSRTPLLSVCPAPASPRSSAAAAAAAASPAWLPGPSLLCPWAKRNARHHHACAAWHGGGEIHGDISVRGNT